MEWVEVAGKTVDDAISAGLEELGISNKDEAVIEVLQEPKSGFLGIGAQLAHVKVSPKPKQTRKRRRRRRKRSGDAEAGDAATAGQAKTKDTGGGTKVESPKRGAAAQQPSGKGGQGGGQRGRSKGAKPQNGKTGRGSPAQKKQGDTSGGGRRQGERPQQTKQDRGKAAAMQNQEGRTEATIEERAEVAKTFIEGLLQAFGLEGDVATEIDDDILKINVSGDQTEALVGPKGSVMQSVLEITRTVVQRKTYGAPRIRLDIGGYAERRREALKIYAGKLAEKVLADGGEIMVEPMNPADRKVIHDAVSEIAGVRSFSEGEEPERAVVLAPE